MRVAITFAGTPTAAQYTVLAALLADYNPKALHSGDPLANAWCAKQTKETFFHPRATDAVDAADYVIGLADCAAALYARFLDMPLVVIYPNGAFTREGPWKDMPYGK